MSIRSALVLLAFLAINGCKGNDRVPVYIYAAISTSSVLNQFEREFEKENLHLDLKLNFAATSTLARQIDAGAPADLFISADTLWTSYLTNRKFKNHEPIALAKNSLVLISSITDGMNVEDVLEKSRTISVAEMEHVPAGRLAKSILNCIGLMEHSSAKIIPSMNVRVAFLNVKNQILDSGIVYRSEALNAMDSDLQIYEFEDPCSPIAIYEMMSVSSEDRLPLAEQVAQSLQSLKSQKLWEEKNFY